MQDKKDYTKLTLEDLLTAEKKIKKNEILSATIIGFLIGIIIYGVAKSGFGFIYIFIPLFLIYGVYNNSKKLKNDLKQIQAEINARDIKSRASKRN